MLQTYAGYSITEAYASLLDELLRRGKISDTTVYLTNHEIVFDLSDMLHNDELHLVFCKSRGLMSYNPQYAAAEAVWYKHATRNPDEIAVYGKIWNSMRDEDGLVNSNYGYQLKRNQSMCDVFRRIKYEIETGADSIKQVFNIATRDNLQLSNDTVCNNQVAILLKRADDGKYDLYANVVARSIDVMFGLPFDLTALQGLIIELASYVDVNSQIIRPASATMEISNVHWYFNDDDKLKPSIDALSKVEDCSTLIATPAKFTPYTCDLTIFAAREAAKNHSFEIKSNHKGSTKSLKAHHRVAIVRNDFDSLVNMIRSLRVEIDSKLLADLRLVYDRINADMYDRKNAVMTADKRMIYLTNLTSSIQINLVDATKSELREVI